MNNDDPQYAEPMTDLITFYTDKINKYSDGIKKVSGNLYWIAVLRFLSFAAFGFCIYACFKSRDIIPVICTLVFFAVFLWLVKRSSEMKATKLLLEKLLFINENEVRMLNHGENSFDNGQSFQTGASYFADLDIFGEQSLYHLLNRTSTHFGANTLAGVLKEPFLKAEDITGQQQAIKVLSRQHDLREMIIARSLLHKEKAGELHEVELWLQQPESILQNRLMNIARFLLPAINVVFIFMSLSSGRYSLLSLSVLLTWVPIVYFGKYTNRQHALMGKKEETLNQYAAILRAFSTADTGGSAVMEAYRQEAQAAHREIKNLSSVANLLDQRLNLFAVILLNSFFMYDIQCLFALEKWKKKNRAHLLNWIACAGKIESLTSFATFAFNHPQYCYPTIETRSLVIKGTALSHPLIKPGASVGNDISLGAGNKLLIITGSNMSGKTTFLRTVGTNTLLAQCGAPVCALNFHFTPVRIYSSIRISDSLQENTSYFMAELKRLREIRERIASPEPSLVLIDEILRGTNSDDKYYGSEQFVQQLIRYNCLTLFATHDLKLSELEGRFPGVVENYCFESTIENDELSFDYRVHKGVAQNKNASFLMKKMDII